MLRPRALAGWRLQLALVLLALASWTLYPHASLGAVLAAYGIAWLALNAVAAARPRALRLSLSRPQAVALVVILAAAPLARAAGLVDRWAQNDGADSVDHQVGAHLRLERTPSIAPPLVVSDRPQTFYVHAPDGRRVAVVLGEGGARLSATALGHGVFRLEYDPRRDGLASPPDGPLQATIEVDGETFVRRMDGVSPLPHPRWLTPSPGRTRVAAVSEETDELVILEPRGLRHRIEVGDGPSDVAFVDEDLLAVSHRHDPFVLFVDAARGRRLGRVRVGPFAVRLARAPEGDRLAVARRGASGRVVLIGASPNAEVLEEVELTFAPDWIAFGPGGDTLIVSSVRPAALHRFARTPAGWTEDAPPLWLGRPAVTMARAPGGERIWVAVTDYQPSGRPHLGNHFVQDQLLRVDVARWRVVDQELTAARTPRQRSAGDVDRGVSPMGIDPGPDGSTLVAFAGTDDVWRYRSDQAVPELFALDEHPLATPHSAVAFADGGFAVSSPVYGAVGLFDARGRHRMDVRLAPTDRALLRDDERALQRRIGERYFYESTRSGVSCQSCHLHGGSDGGKHNIGGATFVATLDTRGLAGTPPYLRDGGYPRLGSLDELAQTLYRGFLRAQGGRRVSLDRFLHDLPRPTPYRQLEARDVARERRGLAVFAQARCPLCHTPPAFTNLGQHPADALFPDFAATHPGYQLDTPSLLSLGRSAPFLVDGRAQTLAQVFTEHDPAGRHGDTAALDEGQLADLVYFLEGL